MRKYIWYLSILVSILSIGWLIMDFGWEPLIVTLLGIIGVFQLAETNKNEFGKAKKNHTGGYKLVVFDLDGTLIRGPEFKYSWQKIWQYLGIPDNIRRKLYNEFVEYRKITYSEWCNRCVEQFTIKGINRFDFKEITKDLTATKNLSEGIQTLKKQGFKTAIVSGGIDTFLEEVIPNYSELFDYVFINRFLWDESGNLIGVEPTDYDFERKVDAIKKICKEEKIKLHQVVFLGEGRNDEEVFKAIMSSGNGFSIAYPGTESSVEHRANVTIYEDNLFKAIEAIPIK